MLSIVILALFSFVFLGIEYIFDNIMACFTTPAGVVMAQNYILGASVIGFVIYPFLKKWISFTKKIYVYASLVVVAICVYFLYIHPSYGILLCFSLIGYIIFGMWGSHIYDLAARTWNQSIYIARNVGIAYALGVGIQFVSNNLIVNIPIQLIVTIFAIILMLFLIGMAERKLLTGGSTQVSAQRTESHSNKKVQLSLKNPEKAGIVLIVIVALMSCIFLLLDTAVTLIHANGAYDIGQLPRIVLAISGLAAGLLFDIGKRKYMYLSMACVTLLSVISIVVMQFGGFFMVGLTVFYLSVGFFVVFFSTSFIDLSYACRRPALWAGLGRAVNNACAVSIGTLSVILHQRQNGMAIMIISLILLVGIMICIFFLQQR